jgi:hypothetical protein
MRRSWQHSGTNGEIATVEGSARYAGAVDWPYLEAAPDQPLSTEVLMVLSEGTALTDSELAARLDRNVSHVNQVCKRLAKRGQILRESGPAGRLCNRINADQAVNEGAIEPGSSSEQREAEREMMANLTAELGVKLAPTYLHIAAGIRMDIDGACAEPLVLVEAWAHQGRAKSAQRHKLAMDAFKLTTARHALGEHARLILLVSDEAAVSHAVGSSWFGYALRVAGVEFKVVELAAETRARLQAAQKRQYR